MGILTKRGCRHSPSFSSDVLQETACVSACLCVSDSGRMDGSGKRLVAQKDVESRAKIPGVSNTVSVSLAELRVHVALHIM